MIPFTAMLWFSILFFGVFGLRRGWKNEVLSSGIIILTMFSITQLDGWLRNSILRFATLTHVFSLEASVLIFAYFLSHIDLGRFAQQKSNLDHGWGRLLVTAMLGGVLGGVNGYLLATSLWYLLDINLYPFPTLISAPVPGSPAAEALQNLPLLGLTGGPFELLMVGVAIALVVIFIKL